MIKDGKRGHFAYWRSFALAAGVIVSAFAFAKPAHTVTVIAQYGLAGDALDSSGNGFHGVNTDTTFSPEFQSLRLLH